MKKTLSSAPGLLDSIGWLLALSGLLLLLASAAFAQESKPKGEYPYPDAVEEGMDESSKNKLPDEIIVRKNNLDVDDEDDSDHPVTHYSEEDDEDNPPPIVTDEDDEEYADVGKTKKARQAQKSQRPKIRLVKPGIKQTHDIRPFRITKDGSYIYDVESSPQSKAFSFRIGSYRPPNLRNPDTGQTFSDIYTDASPVILMLDYEWQLFKGFGKLGLKVGSGIFYANGQGVFRTANSNRSTSIRPEERFNFFMFPNNVAAVYRMQYYDKQKVVPVIEGGADYFGMLELRDDNQAPKIGGAAALHGAAGLALNLDWIDPKTSFELDSEYGINHMWLVGEVRLIHGLNDAYDFSDTLFSGGITIEF